MWRWVAGRRWMGFVAREPPEPAAAAGRRPDRRPPAGTAVKSESRTCLRRGEEGRKRTPARESRSRVSDQSAPTARLHARGARASSQWATVNCTTGEGATSNRIEGAHSPAWSSSLESVVCCRLARDENSNEKKFEIERYRLTFLMPIALPLLISVACAFEICVKLNTWYQLNACLDIKT